MPDRPRLPSITSKKIPDWCTKIWRPAPSRNGVGVGVC